MENALEYCRKNNINFIIFNELKFENGVVFMSKMQQLSGKRVEMSAGAFVEMIFDMINEGIILDVESMILSASSNEVIGEVIGMNGYKFMDKYLMTYGYYLKINKNIVLDLKQLIGNDLYKYLQDEFHRHMLRNQIINIKKSISAFLQKQKSYDDITRFKRIVESL